MEKEISAKTDIVVNIKWLVLLLKSADIFGTVAFTKNAMPGSVYPAAVTIIGSILL